MRLKFADIALLSASMLIGLVVAEGLARIVSPQQLLAFPKLENGEVTYRPNQRTRYTYIEWDYEISINGDGFRDDIRVADIPSRSIVVLGDSFVEGYGVDLKSTMVKDLERIRASNGAPGTVYNAGHSNTSPNTYVTVWETYFATNSLFARARIFMGSHFALYNFVNYAIKSSTFIRSACRALRACSDPHPDDMYLQEHVDERVVPTADVLAGLVRAAAAVKQKTLVVIIPAKEQVVESAWERVRDFYQGRARRFYANDSLFQALHERCIEVLDLTSAMVQHSGLLSKPLYFKYDGHWTPEGHSLAARLIAEKLDLPASPCAP